MQRLVDAGVSITNAGKIVGLTYPQTAGDTFYRWQDPTDADNVAVGVYGLWNRLRGHQAPVGGTTVDDDARTIAQFLRLNPNALDEIVSLHGNADAAVATVVSRTAQAMRRGDYFEPMVVEQESHLPDHIREMRQAIANMDGAADYLSSIPLPDIGR